MEEASTASTQEQQQQTTSDSLLLSFENPNYQFEKQLKNMDQARIDDHLNSNIEPNMYEELCNELKIYTDLSGKYQIRETPITTFSAAISFSLNRGRN